MPVDPRITKILRERTAQGIEISKTEIRVVTPGRVSTQSTPTAPSAPAEVQVPVTDGELTAILAVILPAADALIRKAIANIKADGKLSMSEALALAPEIRNIVSQVVGQLVPAVKGQDARNLVILILAALLQQYVAPHIPAFLRPFVTAATLRTLVKSLEFAYQTWVKPKLGQ